MVVIVAGGLTVVVVLVPLVAVGCRVLARSPETVPMDAVVIPMNAVKIVGSTYTLKNRVSDNDVTPRRAIAQRVPTTIPTISRGVELGISLIDTRIS